MNFASWGPPIDSWNFSVGQPTIPILNKGIWREIKVEIFGLTHGSAGTTNFQLQVGTTVAGVTTYKTAGGDYARIGANVTTNGFAFVTGVASGQTVDAIIVINNFNQARKSMANISGGRTNNNTGAAGTAAYATGSDIYDAFQIMNDAGNNFTAGGFLVYGKGGINS